MTRKRVDTFVIVGCLSIASFSCIFFTSYDALTMARSRLPECFSIESSGSLRCKVGTTWRTSITRTKIKINGTILFKAYNVTDRELSMLANKLDVVGRKRGSANMELRSVNLGQGVKLPEVIMGNKSMCDGIDILVYVQSAVGNFLKRRNIRRTWASEKTFKHLRLQKLFILGKPDKIDDQIKINSEQILHGDILEANFKDSVFNISIKTVLVMRWISMYCLNVKYVIKTDDDVFLNIFSIVESVLPKLSHNTIACHVIPEGSSPIVRDKNSKWFIPPLIFPNKTHLPRFCTGYVVLMTSRTVYDLYSQVETSPFIRVDDVYMFGQLAQSLGNVTFWDLKQQFMLNQDSALKEIRSGRKDLLAVSVRTTNAMEELWSWSLTSLSAWAKANTQVKGN